MSALVRPTTLHVVYNATEVNQLLEDSDSPQPSEELLRKAYRRMVNVGGERFVAYPASPAVLDPLYEECPNFSPVIDDLKRSIQLMLDSQTPVALDPLLLLGDPGVGKTFFAKRVAALLATHFEFVSLATLTAGWLLSGSASTWTGARAGKVATALVDHLFANPVLLLDELDKAGQDQRYDPLGSLYQLLEPETAQHFSDEYLGVAFDCSLITWVATANSLRSIPDPILQRLTVYDVPAPTREQTRGIAQRIYGQKRKELGLLQFEPELPATVLDTLAQGAPRELRKRVTRALGAACLDRRTRVTVADLGPDTAARRPMHF